MIYLLTKAKKTALCEEGCFIYFLVFLFLLTLFLVEQRLARSRCYEVVFVFEHLIYSSAKPIL